MQRSPSSRARMPKRRFSNRIVDSRAPTTPRVHVLSLWSLRNVASTRMMMGVWVVAASLTSHSERKPIKDSRKNDVCNNNSYIS